MYHYQKRLLEEAAKYGKATPQKVEETTNVRESWAIGSGPLTVKDAESFLDDMESAYKKNGLSGTVSTGVDRLTVADMLGEVAVFFRDQPKNTMRLVVRELKKIISPADQGKLKGAFDAMKSKFGESVEVEGETLKEGGMKAALEDFMYNLPKDAISKIKRVMKTSKGSSDSQKRHLIRNILAQSKVDRYFMGQDSAEVVYDYFDTFHGESVEVAESVEVEGETLKEGGVKAALEDFMYDLPKAAIADLKKIGMGDPKKTFNVPKSVGFGRDHKQVMGPNNTIINNIERVLQKHKIPLQFMGSPTWKLIYDYFDTFHGESVEADGEQLAEAQQVIGKYRFTPFVEGSIKGWTISIQNIGEVGYIEEPAKKNTKTSTAPYKVYRTKGASDPYVLKMSAWPGTSNTIMSEKEIRYAPRQLLKAISMWLDKHGKVMHESVEVNENFNYGAYGYRIDPEGGKFVLYVLSYNQGSVRFPDGRKGTVIGRFATKDEAIAKAKKDAMSRDPRLKEEVVEEQVGNYRAFHAKTGQQITVQASSTKEAEAKAVEALKAANKKSVYVRYLGPVKEEVEMEAYGNPFTPSVPGTFAAPNFRGGLKAGDKVKVPHKGKMVRGKIVRFDSGGTSKAQQHGGGYVVDVGEPASILVPAHKVVVEEVEVSEAATVAQQKKNTYEAREAEAKEIAAKILQVAKERGVRVYTDGQRVVSATKEFPKGDIGAFNKAYNDCGMVLTHMRFTKNSNQWGCESAGFGIGAQECVKAGRAQQHKSGDGGSLIIKFLKR